MTAPLTDAELTPEFVSIMVDTHTSAMGQARKLPVMEVAELGRVWVGRRPPVLAKAQALPLVPGAEEFIAVIVAVVPRSVRHAAPPFTAKPVARARQAELDVFVTTV
jgi:hypothetical protein